MTSRQLPDSMPDNHHIRETVRMLTLAVAQIEMSVKDSNGAMETLSHALTTLSAEVQALAEMAADAPPGENSEVAQHCARFSEEMQQALVAIQFYDKLTQRLHHVSHSLALLTQLVADPACREQSDAWSALQHRIRSQYAMPEEHRVFELVMQGMSVEDIMRQHSSQQEVPQKVELF